MTVVIPPSTNVALPCKGDPVTELGRRDCSSQSARLAKNSTSGLFELAVTGSRAPSTSSDRRQERLDDRDLSASHPSAATPSTRTRRCRARSSTSFKGCTVTIPTDPTTGEGGPATISGADCAFVANAEPVTNGELLINGTSVGNLSYGEGSVSSGVASCTTRVINRKIYSWCTCADVTGDGVPDDPRPPCPNSTSSSFSAPAPAR